MNKTKKERRLEIYNRLYDIADRLLKKYNPCGTCASKCEYFGGRRGGCCIGCPFLGPQGCTVKSLGCKLWLCDAASGEWPIKNNLSLLRRQLLRLKHIAVRNHMLYARATREEALEAKDNNISRYDMWYFYYTLNRGPSNG